MSEYSDLKSLANNYRESIADSKNPDMFSLGYQWADKPHRHVYDLCKKLEEAADAIEALEAENVNLLEALKPLSDVYIGVSMKDDAPAAYTVIGTRGVDKTTITAGEVRAARIARAAYLGENKS